jgi:hypothetical protein
VSHDLLDLITEQAGDEIVSSTELWAATFRSYAQMIPHELGECLDSSPPAAGAIDRRYSEYSLATTDLTENQGESLALQRGDESDSSPHQTRTPSRVFK